MKKIDIVVILLAGFILPACSQSKHEPPKNDNVSFEVTKSDAEWKKQLITGSVRSTPVKRHRASIYWQILG